jgi:cell division protease FtsH
MVQRHEVSQHTAELVDREVRRIAQEASARATDLLRRNRGALDALAAALLARETLERADVEAIVQSHRESVPAAASVALPPRVAMLPARR